MRSGYACGESSPYPAVILSPRNKTVWAVGAAAHRGSSAVTQRMIRRIVFAKPVSLPAAEVRYRKMSGFPKFTNEVQHFLYKVLRWDKNMNSFRWNNVARLPGIAKPGKQSAKSRQLWIARHRL